MGNTGPNGRTVRKRRRQIGRILLSVSRTVIWWTGSGVYIYPVTIELSVAQDHLCHRRRLVILSAIGKSYTYFSDVLEFFEEVFERQFLRGDEQQATYQTRSPTDREAEGAGHEEAQPVRGTMPLEVVRSLVQ